jgi:hypothetical protein
MRTKEKKEEFHASRETSQQAYIPEKKRCRKECEKKKKERERRKEEKKRKRRAQL